MKIAIVTGASSGMGKEMVLQLADRFGGLEEIWVVARREEKLDELIGQVPVRIRKFPINITDKAALGRLADALAEEKPDVKVLVNGSGLGRTGLIGEISAQISAQMTRLNCEALTAVTEMVLPYISENSRIIQFASAAAFMPQPGFAVYAATKAFVLSYSRALGAELKSRNISVTAVCPGPGDTEFFDFALADGKELNFYKKLTMVKPEYVVRTAIRDSLMGKEISIAGPHMKLFYVACKILPHSLLMKFIQW